MTHQELVEHLKRLPGDQAAIAASLGISPSYFSDIVSGKRTPGKKLLDAMGLTRVVSYERKRPARRTKQTKGT